MGQTNPTKRQKPTVFLSWIPYYLICDTQIYLLNTFIHGSVGFELFQSLFAELKHWSVGKCTREYVATWCIYSTSTKGPVYLESCEKGSLNKAALSLHTVLWEQTEIIHPVLTMSAGQPALKCLDRPCVTFVHLLPWSGAHELSSESRWGEGAGSLMCVLPGRIYCLLRYFFFEGGQLGSHVSFDLCIDFHDMC